VAPLAITVAAAGEREDVEITTEARCSWTVASQAAWVVPDRTSGQGSGRVRLTVAANTLTTPRSVTVVVAERKVTISQAALVERVDVEGRVEALAGSCPALRFVVDETQIYTDAATRFEDVECDRLRNRTRVRVRGVRDGREVRAERVERRD
jgi:hypothetical protein